MKDVYIVSAKRTAVGNLSGGLSSKQAHELGSEVIKSILNDSGASPEAISEVILGQVLVGGHGQNPARRASIGAGIPEEVPAYGVSKVCGSGLKSINLASQSIAAGESDLIIAGGQESMSQAMHASYLRAGLKMGGASLVDTMILDGLTDAFSGEHMGITAENVAEEYGISREAQDKFAYNSHQKAAKAQSTSRFEDEIVPIEIKSKKKSYTISEDEFVRSDATEEGMAALKPAFKADGVVTAGNASGINDGAAAVMLASEEAVKKHSLKPIAKISGHASAGVPPRIMGIGPVTATSKLLEKLNWQLSDIDLIEANEAFAAQSLAVSKQLGLDESKLNVNGGAIALGHPIGASGARIMVTLLHEMQKQKLDKGLATLCIGGGMGIACGIEKAN
jgi:acetyl-CoA C-acetyltransferase